MSRNLHLVPNRQGVRARSSAEGIAPLLAPAAEAWAPGVRAVLARLAAQPAQRQAWVDGVVRSAPVWTAYMDATAERTYYLSTVEVQAVGRVAGACVRVHVAQGGQVLEDEVAAGLAVVDLVLDGRHYSRAFLSTGSKWPKLWPSIGPT